MNPEEFSDPNFHSKIGKDLATDFDLMRSIANSLVDLAIVKDRSYGASWKRRGGAGAFLTAVRKADRLEAQMEKNGYNVFDVSIAPEDGESIDETLRDAINYYLLILTTRELVRRRLKELQSGSEAYWDSQVDRSRVENGSGGISFTLPPGAPPLQNASGEDLEDGFVNETGSPTSGYVDQG